MRTNVKEVNTRRTHGGSPAAPDNPYFALRRSVASYLLWENEFYESGTAIAERIASLVPHVRPQQIADLAIEARTSMKLRHVPLYLARQLARNKTLRAEVLAAIIQRPDELSEFLALYWKDGKSPLSAQVKKGLASAFTKFNEYELAKYNRDSAIKLRDVLFLCHAKPLNDEQDLVWKRLINKTLILPDTWEVEISSRGNNKDTWMRLISENKLGALALLRNLRNMEQVGVPDDVVRGALASMRVDRVLPFRFIAAAKHAPRYESMIEEAMYRCSANVNKLPGKTIFVVDVSGSMNQNLSSKSEMNRIDSACGLAILARELCETVQIYATAGNDHTRVHKTQLLAARRGFALRDLIQASKHNLGGGGIFLTPVTQYIQEQEKNADRIIVFTDEQDCSISDANHPSKASAFGRHNYILNVSSNQNGINYGQWTTIAGFSESVFAYIQAVENMQ